MSVRLTQDDLDFMRYLMIERNTFESLDEPVLLTSGLIGCYYNHTDKLFGETGSELITKHFDDSNAIGSGAWDIIQKDYDLMRFFEILSESTIHLKDQYENFAYSGGLRKDILFSYPLAVMGDVSHIALHKPDYGFLPKPVLTNPKKSLGYKVVDNLAKYNILHIADLLTVGSSFAENLQNGDKTGWIRNLEGYEGNIIGYQSVVDRLEGGIENIENLTGIRPFELSSYVTIDEDFLREVSTEEHLSRNLNYQKDPQLFGEEFAKTDGVVNLLYNVFDEGLHSMRRHYNVPLRVRKALTRFEKPLRESGNWMELERRLEDRRDILALNQYILN